MRWFTTLSALCRCIMESFNVKTTFFILGHNLCCECGVLISFLSQTKRQFVITDTKQRIHNLSEFCFGSSPKVVKHLIGHYHLGSPYENAKKNCLGHMTQHDTKVNAYQEMFASNSVLSTMTLSKRRVKRVYHPILM